LTGPFRWLRYGPRAFAAEVILAGLAVLILVLAPAPVLCGEAGVRRESVVAFWVDVALVLGTTIATFWTVRWLVRTRRVTSPGFTRFLVDLWTFIAMAVWIGAGAYTAFVAVLIATGLPCSGA